MAAKRGEPEPDEWKRARKRRDHPDLDPDDGRPLVRIGPKLHVNIADATEALRADPDLYSRSSALVRIVAPADGGGPAIRPIGVATLRARIAEFAHVQKKDQYGEWADGLPTDAIVKAIHEAGEWGSVRPLAGVLEHPALVPGGVLDAVGYHGPTGYYYLPAIDFGSVPQVPTQEECADLQRKLWVHLCYDFPYRGMGYPDPNARESDPDGVLRYLLARERPDAWGVLAAIYTLLARPAISGDTPAIVFDASTPGAGKGLQVDVVLLVVFGRILGKLTWPTGGEADHALEQMLGGEARAGAPCVVLDEITGLFGGPAINKVLTSGGRTKLRILGVTETIEHDWRAVMLGAGNNVGTRDNTHRRTILPRLEPPIERPEDHKGFRHPKLPDWIRAHRAELVRAALTVLSGYVAAGKPEVGIDEWGGGFESWSALVARAIKWAGGGDILGCRPAADPEARNEEAIRMGLILDALERLAPKDGSGITIGRLLDALYSPDRVRGRGPDGEPLPVDGFEDARDAINAAAGARGGRKPDSDPLGKVFRTWKKRPIGDRQLQPLGLAGKVQRWGVAKAGT